MSFNNSLKVARATGLGLAMRTMIAATMAASTMLGSSDATASTSYRARIICPIDGLPFTAIMVGSSYQSGMRLDFKPTGAVIAPYPYPVCPGNGFVMYQSTFSEDELSVIRPIVLSDEYRRLRENRLTEESKRTQAAATLLTIGLQQRLLSSVESSRC